MLDWIVWGLSGLLFAVLLSIAWIDLRTQRIPLALVGTGIVLTFVIQALSSRLTWPSVLLGGLVAGGWMLGVYLLSKGRWIGSGDVWVSLLIGLIVGWPSILLSLFTAHMLGGCVAMLLLLTKRKNTQERITFAPFLVMGCFVALIGRAWFSGWWAGL